MGRHDCDPALSLEAAVKGSQTRKEIYEIP